MARPRRKPRTFWRHEIKLFADDPEDVTLHEALMQAGGKGKAAHLIRESLLTMVVNNQGRGYAALPATPRSVPAPPTAPYQPHVETEELSMEELENRMFEEF